MEQLQGHVPSLLRYEVTTSKLPHWPYDTFSILCHDFVIFSWEDSSRRGLEKKGTTCKVELFSFQRENCVPSVETRPKVSVNLDSLERANADVLRMPSETSPY